MDFKVNVRFKNKIESLWWDEGLQSSSNELINHLYDAMKNHISSNSTIPNGIDFDSDTENGANVYHAIINLYDADVIVNPTDEFLGFDPDVIY